jgi:formylglycine-generating enzyme required for sulfatase activity
MGVFEVTQKQWERVMGDWPAFFHNPAHRESRPVENISYDAIRGPGWPAPGGILDGDTFMGRLRARTGRAFDLPTEAQWEYAGRAGVGTSLHSGFNVTNLEAEADARASELGRYAYNGGSHYEWNVDTNGATAAVGSYRPNAWGLYDFHGNVWEWCRDWYGAYPTSAVDPAGAPTGAYRVRRGGSWANSAGDCRLAFREGLDASAFSPRVGFRVATPQEP